jgi:hypothetical protein
MRSPLRWVWIVTPSLKSWGSRSVSIHGPSGHVVGDGVAEDHVGRLLRRDVPADTTDDDRELAFVVDPLALRRVEDLVARTHHRGVGLEEHQWLLGHLVAELGGVAPVVAADRDDLAARDHRREQPDVGEEVLGLGRLDAGVQRVAGQLDDDAVLGGLAELVQVAADHAVRRVVARREPRDTHGPEPIHRGRSAPHPTGLG